MKEQVYLRSNALKKEPFTLPPEWHCIVPTEEEYKAQPAVSVEEMAGKALSTSGAELCLRKIASAQRIVVIVDDATRPTPVKQILSVLFDMLSRLGMPKNHADIVVALGSHGPLSQEALKERLGDDIVSTCRIIQHDAWQNDLIPVEGIDDALPVKVNPWVAGADVRIGISSILPHPFAGYGGGPKILMPGVCDVKTLARHHMVFAVHPSARIGMTEGNPFHEFCMEIASKIGLDLSINCVYDKEGTLTGMVAGGLSDAFGEAVKLCREKLGYALKEKMDITISSTYPHTHGIQFCKGLCTPSLITKETGAILLYAPLTGPLSDEFVTAAASLRAEHGEDVAAYISGVMSEGRLVLEDKSPEFNMAIYDLLGRKRPRTILVSEQVPPDIAEKLGFESAPSIDEGIKRLKKSYPTADAVIFSSGGLIVP